MPRIYYKGIELDQIRSFCRVARLGSFAAAAAAMGLSSPTIWRQVRALERECKSPLLVRNGRAVQLTREGKLALQLLEPHLAGIDSVRDVLREKIADLPRQLTVASTAVLLSDFLPEPLRRFVAAEPTVLLSLLNETADVALRRVLDGEADVGILPYLPNEPRDHQAWYEDLFELPWLLFTAAGHPLSKKRSLRLADLTAWPWIVPAAQTQPRRQLDAVLTREGLRDRVRVVMESRNFALTQVYVKSGLGIAVWYSGAPRLAVPGIWTRSVTPWFGVTPVAIVTRQGRHPPAHVEAFLQIVRDSLETNANDKV